MKTHDLIVVGGGVSGLGFAYFSRSYGKETLLLERESRLGGCVQTERLPDGYWFELGTHTCYNSYGSLLDMVDGCGLREEVLQRVRVPFKLLRDGAPESVLRSLRWLELLRSLPGAFALKKEGRTVYAYYSRIVGRRNYGRVVGPLLSAVPCQNADAFPVAMLFKRRPRRKDYPRTFTLRNGLQTIVDAVARRPGLEIRTGVEVESIQREAEGYTVRVTGGETLAARAVAIAVPPSAAAIMLRDGFPELADSLAHIGMVAVETLGVVVPREKVAFEPVMGLAPVDDLFFSAVTRDPVPDPKRRAFAFHFRPNVPREKRIERVAQVLGVGPEHFEHVAEKRVVLPAPVLGHEAIVAEIDRLTADTRLAVTGNYFAGLAVEDCLGRSRTECARVAMLG